MPRITKPLANEEIYICNENYSSHQAWVEGSLESSECVLEKLGIPFKNKFSRNNLNRELGERKPKRRGTRKHTMKRGGGAENKKTQKWREYTLVEVEKHNKKSDAWIVINSKVVDITKWIPQHPGGDVIMKGVGKDATKLFSSIGHDEYAKKMLKKYQIGVLV